MVNHFCFLLSLITPAVPLLALPSFTSSTDLLILDSYTAHRLASLVPIFLRFYSLIPRPLIYLKPHAVPILALPSLTSFPASSTDPPSIPHSPINLPSTPPRLTSLVPLLHALPSLSFIPPSAPLLALPSFTSLSFTDPPSTPYSSIDSNSTPHSSFSSYSFHYFSPFIYGLLSFCFLELPSSTLLLLHFLLLLLFLLLIFLLFLILLLLLILFLTRLSPLITFTHSLLSSMLYCVFPFLHYLP